MHYARVVFPRCDFKFSVTEPRLFLGRPIVGQLDVVAPEPVPRAEFVLVTYSVHAAAEYTTSDNKRRTERRELSRMVVKFDVPEGGLAKGTHAFPFAIDPPPGLPPTFDGCRCTVEHRLEARVDVDWAIDPVSAVALNVELPPIVGTRAPFATRTPPSFHDEVALEISLASTTIVQGEQIYGQIALRGGATKVDAIVIDAMRVAGLARRPNHEKVFTLTIPKAALASGDPVPFVIQPDPRGTPSFVGDPVSTSLDLVVSADIPWALDPSMALRMHVVPPGSVLHGAADTAPVGAARVRQSARVMAERIGLPEGRTPVLVEGAIGPVWVRVSDAPHGPKMGVRANFSFPDTELGIVFRPRGWLGSGASPGLSPALAKLYTLAFEPDEGAPPTAPEAAAAFVGALSSGLEGASSIQLGDGALSAHFTMFDDDGERIATLASLVRHKAEQIVSAVAALPPAPWMTPTTADAWRAAAAEVSAVLVANEPKLWRVPVSARLFGGVDVTIFATVGTRYGAEEKRTIVDVDLKTLPLPEGVDESTIVGSSSSTMTSIRAVFPHVSVRGKSATLARAGTTEDPRSILPILGELLSWVLEVRGLRREAAAPYR